MSASSMSATHNEEHKVAVSIVNGVVKLVFDGDEDDAANYGADTNFADHEIKSLTNRGGKTPRAKNMRALLTCDGGTLKFDNEEYQIAVHLRKEDELTAITDNDAHGATLTEDSLGRQSDVLQDYIDAANSCTGEDIAAIWQSIEDLQNHADFLEHPSPFVCVLDSSGTGKTQLAATTAIHKTDNKVIYLYTGMAEDKQTAQVFYRPHLRLWKHLKPLLRHLCQKVKLNETTEQIPVGAGAILDHEETHLVFKGLNNILFGDNMDIVAKDLRNKVLHHKSKFFVFMDEVPAKSNFFEAIMLRNCLRAVGIAPVLMSTHSGAHNAVPSGSDSRTASDIPDLWCRLITTLPVYRGTESRFIFQKERPLVCGIIAKHLLENKDLNISTCAEEIKKYFRKSKPGAWDDPIFQLCQLFRSSKDFEHSSKNSHRLVGEHFGHFEMNESVTGNDNSTDILRKSVDGVLEGRVRLPVADEEPFLFLALTMWCKTDISSAFTFPLCNKKGQPISVRTAMLQNAAHFTTSVDAENTAAMKLNGDFMEIVSLASITLASLRSDEKIALRGVALCQFVATVFCLMDNGELTITVLEKMERTVGTMLKGVGEFSKIVIPAVASTDSGLPLPLYPTHCGQRGRLKRPRDEEMRDGYLEAQSSSSTVWQGSVHVECKNYCDGISSAVLEDIVKRMRPKCKLSFVFISSLKGLWKGDGRMEQFFETVGLKMGAICFLHLKSDSESSWLASMDGTKLEPIDGIPCKYLVVLFDTTSVESVN